MKQFVSKGVYTYDVKGEKMVTFIVKKDHEHYINQMVKELPTDKDLKVEIKINREDKSLAQVRKVFQIISMISDEINGSHTKEETDKIYADFVEEAQIKVDIILALPDTKEKLKDSFRVVKMLQSESRIVNGVELFVFKLYPGLSKFTTEEAQRFIEVIVRRASELNIHTDL